MDEKNLSKNRKLITIIIILVSLGLIVIMLFSGVSYANNRMKTSVNDMVIDEEKNIRWHIVRGVIEVPKLAESLKGLYDSSDSYSQMNVFWDLQEADFSSVSSEDVQSLMGFVVKHWGRGGKSKAAIVVSRDLDYGMSRMYQLLMEGTTTNKIAIFKDKNEALVWFEAD